IGIHAGRRSDHTRYLVVATTGAGMWRAVPGPADADPWTWTQVDTTIGSHGAVALCCPIIAGHTTGQMYCFDRGHGVWRSTTDGMPWTLIWNAPVSDGRSGWLATTPTANGELWVSTNDGLYKLSNAGSGTVGNGITLTKISSGYFPDGA